MKLSAILSFAAGLAALACTSEPSQDEKLAEALANRAPPQPYKPLLPTPGGFQVLAVLAGQGAGAIRIGANVAQVERLMGAPCEIRSENLCRYVTRGMDFNLIGGITQSIYIQRAGRPAGRSATGEPTVFGFFQGMIPPDLRLGMLPEAIQQYLGAPKRIEKVQGPNPQSTVERHYYPGLVLDYDWWAETRKLILGGILVIKDANAAAEAMAKASAAAPGQSPNPGGSAAPSGTAGGAPPSPRPAPSAAPPPVRQPEPR